MKLSTMAVVRPTAFTLPKAGPRCNRTYASAFDKRDLDRFIDQAQREGI
jgi:hypothetical protein